MTHDTSDTSHQAADLFKTYKYYVEVGASGAEWVELTKDTLAALHAALTVNQELVCRVEQADTERDTALASLAALTVGPSTSETTPHVCQHCDQPLPAQEDTMASFYDWLNQTDHESVARQMGDLQLAAGLDKLSHDVARYRPAERGPILREAARRLRKHHDRERDALFEGTFAELLDDEEWGRNIPGIRPLDYSMTVRLTRIPTDE